MECKKVYKFDKIYENIKPAESFRFMQEICTELGRLEYLVNHNKSKFTKGDESESEIWECILNILESRISKK